MSGLRTTSRRRSPTAKPAGGPVDLFVRYSEGTGRFLRRDGRDYILLTMDMKRFDGAPDGSFQGLLFTRPLDPAALMQPPAPPPGPIDQPSPFDTVPPAGSSKGTWTFADGSSLTALGPGIVTLVPLANGSFAFLLAGMAIVSNGSGRFAGARGIKNTLGLTIIDDPTSFGKPGSSFRGQTVEVFQVVKAADVLKLPPGGLPAPGSPPPPGLSPPLAAGSWPPALGPVKGTRRIGKVEQMIRTSDGTGRFQPGTPPSILLDMAMRRPDGAADGRFQGLLLTGALDPAALIRPPSPPPGAVDEPLPFEEVPVAGNSKGTWTFPQGSLTELGPGIVTLVPLVDGSFAFLLAGMAIASNGTGGFAGARGIKNTLGQTRITDPSSFGRPGAAFAGRTVEVFNTVNAADVLSLPPAGARSRSVAGFRPAAGTAGAASPAPPGGGIFDLPVVRGTLNALSAFDLAEVTKIIEKAAYFNLLAVSRPGPGGAPVNPAHAGRPVTLNAAGADIELRWTPIPEDYEGHPNRPAPAADLDPSRSQRIEFSCCIIRFHDRPGSSLRAYGTGRTFPATGPQGAFLRLAVAMDVLEGFDELEGLAGTIAVNGVLDPAGGLSLELMVRMVDVDDRLAATEALTPPAGSQPGPADLSAVYLYLLGEVDPSRHVVLRTAGLKILGSRVFERMRPGAFSFSVCPDLRGQVAVGPIVGEIGAQLDFNPLALPPINPIQTTQGVFTFQDPDGRRIGTIAADMVEGRSFRTYVEGVSLPCFRFGGFGPIQGGSGMFANATGMMTMNALISVFPRTLSNLYILRIDDPDGRLRAQLKKFLLQC